MRGALLVRALATVVAVVSSLACAQVATADAPAWGPAIDLGTSNDTPGRVQVAMAPDGYAVAMWDDVDNVMRYSTLTATGPWTPTPGAVTGIPSNLGDGGLAALAIDSAGTATAIGGQGATVALRLVKGSAWSEDGEFDDVGTGNGQDWALAVASSGERAAIGDGAGWVDGPTPGQDGWRSSSVKPASWPVRFGTSRPSLRVLPGGAAVGLFLSNFTCCTGALDRVMAVDRQAGMAFGTSAAIYAAPDGMSFATAQLALDPDGTAVGVIEQVDGADHTLLTTTRSAGSWSTPTAFAAGTAPRIAQRADGSAALTFVDPGSDTLPARVMLSTRSPGGGFSTPVAVDSGSDPVTATASTFLADGTLVIVWIRGGRVLAALRPPGGQFGAATPLSVAGTPQANGLALAGGPAGDAVAMWSLAGSSVDESGHTHARIQASQLGGNGGVQQPPSCRDGSVQTTPDTPVVITLDCTDPNGDPLQLEIVGSPTHGTLGPIDQSGRSVTYTPGHGYQGNDSFSFRASDGQANSPNAQTQVSVAVPTPPSTPPANNGGNSNPGNSNPGSSSTGPSSSSSGSGGGNPNPSGSQGCTTGTNGCSWGVTCPEGQSGCGGNGSDLTGRLSKLLVSAARHVALIHSVHFHIPAGKTRRIQLKLTKAGSKALHKKHRLTVKFGLTLKQGAKTWHSVRTLHFTIRKHKHAHH